MRMSLDDMPLFWNDRRSEGRHPEPINNDDPDSAEYSLQNIELNINAILKGQKDTETISQEFYDYLDNLPIRLFQTTDYAQKINDRFYNWIEQVSRERDGKWDEMKDVIFSSIHLLIIEKLVESAESLPYLHELVFSKPLPSLLESGYVSAKIFDDNHNGPATFDFYIAVAESIRFSEMGTEAAPLLEEMLAKCPELIKQYYFPDNEEQITYVPFTAFMGETEDEEYSTNLSSFSSTFSTSHGDIEFPRNVIMALRDKGRQESIPVIINYISTLGPECAVLLEYVVETCKAIDSRSAIIAWLNAARSDDPITRRFALSVIYQLEDASLDIDQDGLSYLQKRYDLGTEFNNPDFRGQRITNSGEVGIFEKSSGELKKFFEAKGLDSDDLVIRAQLLDITYETLFTPLPGETPEERQERESLLKNFQEHYSEFFDNDFFKTTGLHFNDLGFQEQAAFISLYERSSADQKKDLSVFGLQHGLSGLRTLLVMNADADPKMGHTIISAGISLPPRTAEQIFKTCNYLINIAL